MASTEKNAESIAFAKTLANTPWCDDYEKMISGMVLVRLPLLVDVYSQREDRYDSFDPELIEGRLRARKLVKKFNDYLPDDATEESLIANRNVMLKELIGHVGKGAYIDPPFRVDYGCNISLGDGFYGNFKCVC